MAKLFWGARRGVESVQRWGRPAANGFANSYLGVERRNGKQAARAQWAAMENANRRRAKPFWGTRSSGDLKGKKEG